MRIAAIDLGSNSFHLVVVDASKPGSLKSLLRDKEMLRLGDVVSREGRVTEAALARVIATIRRFKSLADSQGVTELASCATSAIREADNGGEVVDAIYAETGVRVRVLSGMEEARLILGAVRASVLIDPGPALCLDLGGGSLEIMVGGSGGLLHAATLPLGVARLSAELVAHDPPSVHDARRLRERLTANLAPVAEETAALRPTMAVGTSGTFCDLARIVVARRTGVVPVSVNQVSVSREELLVVHDAVMAADAGQRARIPGLDARRVDQIPAGSMVTTVAMELFGVSELTVSEWALREGMVLDVISRFDPAVWTSDPRAIRRSSVLGLARRCGWDEAHGRQVARLATQLFDSTTALHGLGLDDRELLEHAALLHDIGHHVAHESHHKHTCYLIQHGRLRGFAPKRSTHWPAWPATTAGATRSRPTSPTGRSPRPARRRSARWPRSSGSPTASTSGTQGRSTTCTPSSPAPGSASPSREGASGCCSRSSTAAASSSMPASPRSSPADFSPTAMSGRGRRRSAARTSTVTIAAAVTSTRTAACSAARDAKASAGPATARPAA